MTSKYVNQASSATSPGQENKANPASPSAMPGQVLTTETESRSQKTEGKNTKHPAS